jgi:hypothetical protein
MKATLLFKQRRAIDAHSFASLVVWKLPEPVPGSTHLYKYSMAYIVSRVCVLRYDNERGKGDHRHWGELETPYVFTTPEQLIADFWADIATWRASP